MNFPYKIQYTRRKNSIALKISDNFVTILAPENTSYLIINNLLKQKTNWIKKQLSINSSNFANNQFFLFGQKKLIRYEKANSNYFSLCSKQDLTLYYNKILSFNEIMFLFEQWQKNFARKYILARINELSSYSNLTPNKISLKKTYNQWGSCSKNKNISLAINLICTKKTVIDYVIIHELCHLLELNHSERFWQLVQKFCANYKAESQWLKTHNFLIRHNQNLKFQLQN